MSHAVWPDFSYYGLRAWHLLLAIEALAASKSADPSVPPELKVRYLELQAKAIRDRLNMDHGSLRRYVLDLPTPGEGAGQDEAAQILSLTHAFEGVMRAYALMLDLPVGAPELDLAITELDHAGGGLNMPPPPAGP